MPWARRLSIAAKFSVFWILLTVALSLLGLAVFATLRATQVNGPVYVEIIRSKDLIADILPPPEYILEAREVLFELVDAQSPAEREACLQRFAKLRAEFEERQVYWRGEPLEEDTARLLLRELRAPALEFFEVATAQLLPAVQAGDVAAARALLGGPLRTAFATHRAAVDKLVQLLTLRAAEAERRAAEDIAARTAQLVAVAVIILLFVFTGTVAMARAVVAPLHSMRAAAATLAQGDVSVQVTYRAGDELGALADSFRSLIAYFNTVSEAARALGEGDLEQRLAPRGPNDILANSMARMRGALQAVIAESTRHVACVAEGDLSGRASVPQAAGAYRALLDGLNRLTDAVAAPIGRVKVALATLEQGDLTTRVEGSFAGAFGQMQRTFNSALAALDDGLSKVALTATQVADASNQIASTSQAVALGATQQAQSLQETSASLNQMLEASEQSAEGAVQAQACSRTAREASGAGVEAVGRMQHSMQRIHQASEATAAIVRDINEIAFQTNLLALNAAVEAARAQDAGRSFGVVADEVRNLALRTKEAARKTEALIRDSIQLAQAGGGVAHQVSANLSSIVAVVGEVGKIIETIAVASTAQAGEVRTVQGAVASIDKVTQHNATSAAASSAASSAMALRARELTALVSRYRVSRPPSPGRLRAV